MENSLPFLHGKLSFFANGQRLILGSGWRNTNKELANVFLETSCFNGRLSVAMEGLGIIWGTRIGGVAFSTLQLIYSIGCHNMSRVSNICPKCDFFRPVPSCGNHLANMNSNKQQHNPARKLQNVKSLSESSSINVICEAW